jgi:hypothetical protein
MFKEKYEHSVVKILKDKKEGDNFDVFDQNIADGAL